MVNPTADIFTGQKTAERKQERIQIPNYQYIERFTSLAFSSSASNLSLRFSFIARNHIQNC
jgi:hypothetical protein